ncbi:MAG TPA: hypothetical protein VGO57_03420 [Verrucomicrobiae bacterium]|jgi:hypothetical protein
MPLLIHLAKRLLQRHLVAFWDGSKESLTTFWPASVTPGEVLNLLKEASGKYIAGGKPAQLIKLSNGINARLVVYGGKIVTFLQNLTRVLLRRQT